MSDAKNVIQNHCIPIAFATPTAYLKAGFRNMAQNKIAELE